MDWNAQLAALDHEKYIRLYWFLGTFALMAFWEFRGARRKEKIPRKERWPHNLALTVLNALVLRMLFPAAAIGAAYLAQSQQFGLFNWVEVPALFSVLFTLVVMDWVVYYQHRAFHAFPLFWKFHRMHHTDLEVDVTTGLRFHTVEMAASMLVKSFFVLLLGAPAFGVFIFELVLNVSSLFSHSNVRMPDWLDRALRFLVVTPDMHRVHHSILPAETNSDFGFIFSLWDRLLGTYRAQPKEGHEKMKVGLDVFHDEKYLPVLMLLEQPFLDKGGKFAWNNPLKEK